VATLGELIHMCHLFAMLQHRYEDFSSEILIPKWGTLGRAQDRASAASRNDVLEVGDPRPPNRLY
jgi:hypothetical protein